MAINQALQELKQQVKEMTCALDTEDYIDFYRDLSEWAKGMADIADYSPEMQDYDEDDN